MKSILMLFVASLVFFPPFESSWHESNDRKASAAIEPYSHSSHPSIPGFTHNFAYDSSFQAGRSTTGYFFSDMDVYYMDFTNDSRLYLIRTQVDFTPGCEAYDNGHTEYDNRFELDKGYIHVRVFQKQDGSRRSSSLKFKEGWPQSSSFTSTIASSFGVNTNFGTQFGSEISFTNGTTIKANADFGLSLTFNRSVAISGPEPALSHQFYDSTNQMEWSYEYAATGHQTYSLETYYLFEAKNDGQGYQDYSFAFDIDVRMDNVAYDTWWWEQHDKIDFHDSESYGLY